jgi:hypothetical protein
VFIFTPLLFQPNNQNSSNQIKSTIDEKVSGQRKCVSISINSKDENRLNESIYVMNVFKIQIILDMTSLLLLTMIHDSLLFPSDDDSSVRGG